MTNFKRKKEDMTDKTTKKNPKAVATQASDIVKNEIAKIEIESRDLEE